MFTYNHITGAKLSYMHVPVEVDSLVVRGKLQQDRREANEARHMAWEDFFATQWGKAERDAAAKTQQRLQHQIEQLSKITVTSRHFELWNLAIDRHYYEYISYSLQDPTLRDTLLSNVHNGLTPLARACTTKDYALVRILLAHGADVTAKSPSSPNAYMRSIFCAAVADFRVFELLVEHLPTARELRGLDKDGLSLVHLAAQGGYVTALEALLKMPITSDLVDTTTSKLGYTALHYAVVGGHADCVAVLLRYMSPSVAAAMTSDGCNALHLALRVDGTHFHLEQLVENFINANCDSSLFEAVDANGATALHLSIAQNLERIALRLMDVGKTPMNVCTKGGIAALHLAVTVENLNLVRALQHHNAMIDIMDDNGQTPLLTAALLNHTECIRFLLDCGADAGCQNKEGHAPLHYLASYCTDPDTFQLFFDKDVDVNVKSAKGNVPLHFAAMKGNEVAAKALLHHGADVSLLNEDKRSVVFLARQWGHLDLEEYFKLVLKDATEVPVPSLDHTDPTTTELDSGGGHVRKTKPATHGGTRDSLKSKKVGVVLPSVRPVTAVDPAARWENDSDVASAVLDHPSTTTPLGRHVCMTPYVKRQLFGRVRAPNQPVKLTSEMDELLRYNQSSKPAPEHPQAKNMVRRCKAGVNIPWEATMPLGSDTLERRLKPSTQHQLNAANHVKSMPELRAEFQFVRTLVWQESAGTRRSRHSLRSRPHQHA
ncbi:hypothetical protein H310_02194 [Aphanomyces invadans]|uniref:Uncharacterized protein n=1 Tax=Aphanomyces invadans TaxID=157072 RepID=A0A024UPH9_9STRA|nr:hypothetical protein H310_02194 [Aphanomyces invadans]ETW07752.1 hypothetical protein H310_02194 [Aphanomyces invadans]|eukprot:XP_008863845.1 hypothetical protein H310_02194 [Aphanomyces invadans]